MLSMANTEKTVKAIRRARTKYWKHNSWRLCTKSIKMCTDYWQGLCID